VATMNRSKMKMMITAVVVLLAAVFFTHGDSLMSLMPSESYIDEQLLELKREQKKLQSELILAKGQNENRTKFKGCSKWFWITSRDGEPDAKIHAVVEEAAKFAGVKLSVLGGLRRPSRVREGVLLFEFNLGATSTMKALTSFFSELEDKNPRFYWKRLQLRPNPQTPGQVTLNGNLKFFVLTDDSTVNYLTGGVK